MSCFPTGATLRVMISSCPCLVTKVRVACSLMEKNLFPVTNWSSRGLFRVRMGIARCFITLEWIKFPIAPESMNAYKSVEKGGLFGDSSLM